MSDAHGNGPAGKGPPKGEDKKERDDTIVKVTGVAIATGIAYSIYKSVIVGKKTEEPLGTHHHHGKENLICIDKPEGLSKFEAGAKEKAGEFAAGTKEFEGAAEERGKEAKSGVEAKGREAKSALAAKGQEVKEALVEGKEKAGEQEKKAEQQWWGWFNWLGGQGKKAKDEVGENAEKAKEETKKTVEGGEKFAEEKGKNFYDKTKEGEKFAEEKGKNFYDKTKGGEKFAEEKEKNFYDKTKGGEKFAEEKGKNFFDKTNEQLIRGKEEVQKDLAAAEANVEKAGSAVVHKVQKLAHGSKPHGGGKPKKGFKEYGIVSGDTLWSISKKFGVSIDELKSANGIWNADFIVAGDTLAIPK